MKKTLVIAGILALSIVPTPTFSEEVEVKEINTLSEQLLHQSVHLLLKLMKVTILE